MDSIVAGKMVDKLVARGLIYGRLTENDRQKKINDLISTYFGYDQRIVYEVFVEWLNTNRGVPQPADIIPEIRKLMNEKNSPKLEELTPEQVTELRGICTAYGVPAAAYKDLTEPESSGSLPKIRGDYQIFKERLIKQIQEGYIK